jgi:uncharacterized membrane protein YkoI
MLKPILLGASALVLTLSVAAAQSSPPAGTAASPGQSAAPAARTSGKLDAIRSAAVPLGKAIDAAERQGGQGRAVSAEFERADGDKAAHYEIKVVYPDGKLVEHTVDATSGQVT